MQTLACTINAGRMEVAYIVIVDSEDEYGLIGCVFVRRTHFLATTGMSVTALRDQFELLASIFREVAVPR